MPLGFVLSYAAVMAIVFVARARDKQRERELLDLILRSEPEEVKRREAARKAAEESAE